MVSALNRMLLRDLWHLRGQALAAALVVACGVASFVALYGTYLSLVTARASYYAAYRFADVFVQMKRAPESVAGHIRAIPGVAAVRTRVVKDVALDIPGLDEPATARLVSVPDQRRSMLNDLHIRRGRYIAARQPDEVLASEAFAIANRLEVGDTVGAVINGRWKRLRIVGIALSPEYIYEVGGGTIFPDNRRFGVLWMGREALGAAFAMDGAFNDAAITLTADAVAADVIARLDQLLARYGGIGGYGREDQVSHRFISDEIAQNRVSATYVPAIFLGVAAFLLHIALARLVALQRTEIALLKAFGYDNLRIGLHYIALALLAVAGGIALGAAGGWYLGTGMTALYRDYYHFPELVYAADFRLFALALAVSVGAAVMGALGAARKAARLPPAEAMRPEPPARFRAGLLEHAGLTRVLPPSARMIARNVARRPWRALLSMLVMAVATGILVVGGYFFDAIRYLVRVQFEIVQREHVTVIFNNPRPESGRFELARLPGVLRAEPFRSVPVRLRHEHRSRRVELTGLESGAELRRLVDRKLRPVQLAGDGIVLTAKLAQILGVAAGHNVTVEVLEGVRAVRSMPVTGVVDQMIGVGAYMERGALGRMLGEDAMLSGAYLHIDTQEASGLYARLKRTPAVSAVAIREAMLESFRELLEQSLLVSTIINVIFACVIAFGVVYNEARITLSERGNELASLRVLGFTQREVAAILLGEQALLTALAVPVGLALGYGVSALLSHRLDTELYRIPLVVSAETFAFALAVVAVAASLSGLLVASRLRRLDLVAVLKTRE